MTYVRCHDDIGWNVLRPEVDARGADQRARLLHASQFYAGEVAGSYAQGATFQTSDPSVVHGTNGMTAALVGLSSAQTPADREVAKSRLVMMQALSLFVGGLPLIYMGDEWGQGNTSAEEIAKRQGPDGRELHRPMFDEIGFACRHDASTIEGQIYAALRAFIQAKKQHEELSAQQSLSIWHTGSSAVLGLKRGTHVLGLFNFSGQTQSLLPIAASQHCITKGTDLISGQAIELNGLQLPAYACVWIHK
jgi:amylosucrase